MVPSNGLAGIEDRVLSVVITVGLFTILSGISLLALIVFGVRAGLMAPRATAGMPPASGRELSLFLGSAFLSLAGILLLVFMGLAENDLDNPLFLPLTLAFIGLSGLLFLAGVGFAFRTIRRARRPA